MFVCKVRFYSFCPILKTFLAKVMRLLQMTSGLANLDYVETFFRMPPIVLLITPSAATHYNTE